MSCALAPGAIIMAIGSPGATRNSKKTTTATPNSVTTAMTTRPRTADAIIAVAVGGHHGCQLRAPPSPFLAHEGRLHGAGNVRRHFEISLVHNRLDILQERDDIPLFGDVTVDRLVACDALGLVLLAPKRPDLGIEVGALPARMRRRPEHRVAGRGRRVGNRIAPVVERERGQLVAGSQLELLGDLVDLDVGFVADLAPHADDRLDHLVILRLETPGRLNRRLERLLR